MGPITVLAVDDQPECALLCKRLLSRAGYMVVALTDPKEAVDWLKEHAADLLLVDIRMPEVDGFELIALARRFQPDIAVLVMTGFGTVETAIHALRQGVDGLILKPFQNGEELIQAAKLSLADSQQNRDAARINALRPLFTITKSLFSKDGRTLLLDLIVNAVLGQLRCRHTASINIARRGPVCPSQRPWQNADRFLNAGGCRRRSNPDQCRRSGRCGSATAASAKQGAGRRRCLLP